ncbi:MAG: TatD family hydrolase [Bacteroidales bacterium]|nr:TatD family hydrolase [Bacteroidales bacterium]
MNPGSEIRYIDFHSHRPGGGSDTITIMNLMAGEDVPADFPQNTLFSAGIHPWQLTEENAQQLQTELLLTAAHPHVVLIGEAGFDRLKGPAREVQYAAFLFQAALAREMHKPMVIHCVRGWEELRRAHREVKPGRPWVIHGFRGNSRLAASLAGEGFWFSLGTGAITEEILNVIPRERILLETDDTTGSIADVYRLFAATDECSEATVSGLIRKNFNALFNFRV